METTWIELWGTTIKSPVTAGTNLLLAIQCATCFYVLRESPTPRARLWGCFFAMMSAATLAGVFKHGAGHALSVGGMGLVLALSNLASGASTTFAQRATIRTYADTPRTRRWWHRLVYAQLTVFISANLLVGPEIMLLIANTVLGLVPVIVIESMHRRKVCGAGPVAMGLSVSILTGAVYLLGVSLGRWFNHIDIAHALMGVSLLMIYVGVAQSREAAWT